MSRSATAGQPADRQSDGGFTLIETMVALTLLVIVIAASTPMLVGTFASISHQGRAQTAATVANDAMQQVVAVPAVVDTHGVSGLLAGRAKADVQAAFAANAGVTGVSLTNPAWDTNTPIAASQSVPITSAETLGSVTYTWTTLIGSCYRATVVANALCQRTQVAPTDSLSLRAIVVVRWSDPAGGCGGSTCSFSVQTLIDPHTDLTWNANTTPVAVDDLYQVKPSASLTMSVLTNDVTGFLDASPVSITYGPTAGTAAAQSNGTIVYRAPAAAQEVTLRYRVKNRAGQTSDEATVTIEVNGATALDDAATAKTGQTVTISVSANDTSIVAPGKVAVVSAPAAGTATASGGTVVYVAPVTAGTYTFTYAQVNASGLQISNTATVTVTVTAWAAPITPPATLSVALSSPTTATTTALGMAARTGNPTGYLYQVQSVTVVGSSLTVLAGTTPFAGQPVNGTDLSLTAAAGTIGSATVTYLVTAPDGQQPTATGTLVVNVGAVTPSPTTSASATPAPSGSAK